MWARGRVVVLVAVAAVGLAACLPSGVPDTTPPGVPTNLVVTNATTSQLTLSWTSPTDNVGVVGFYIFRNGVPVATASVTSYVDTGLSANTTYVYTVTAVDAAGNASSQSDPVSGTTLSSGSGFPFAARISANNRYLLDQFGNPYMIVGDSPHSLAVNLTEAQAATYFADRQAHGINAAWIEVLCNTYTNGRSDGSTYDGITPFTTANDFSTPNPAYFQRLSDMVNLAAAHGITVFLDALETAGWQSQYESNGATKDYNYGAYLGNLFKNAPNVVWLTGNDYTTWADPTDDADVTAVAKGVKSTDPNHLQTSELNATISSSLDDQNWASIINLNGVYTYYPTYDEVLHAYNQTPTMPTFMQEANYEFENNTGGPSTPTTDETLRRQEYWTATSGGNAGQLYGNNFTWNSDSWADEQANLDTSGVTQLQYMENLFTAREWFNLVPDQSHTFLTAGAGTYDSAEDDVLQSDYATAAVTPDGSFGAVYVPTARQITVNLSRMTGAITARWFDPSNNTFQAIAGSPFASSSGAQRFTTPGSNSEGNGDWLLVLDGQADRTPPSVPTGVTVTGTTGATASLSWTASTDNVGVAGYKVFRNGTQVLTTAATSFTDIGLAQNTTYGYTVAAYDFASNTSGPSASVNATTNNTAPPATPALVQLNSATPQTPQSSVSLPYSQLQSSRDTNIAVIGFTNAATITSVTDTKGNAYSLAAPLTHNGSVYQAVYYAKNVASAAAGANTVTVAFSTAVQYTDVRIAEYSGLDATNPVDGTSSATGSATTADSGTVTTTKPVELLFAAGTTTGSFTDAGPDYTLRLITDPDADIVEDQVVTAAGSYNATASQSGNEVLQLVAFKAAGQ
jgi:chitodextrinase